MAIETDFKVYPDSKVIRHDSDNDNVYTVATFYSWLQDLFDEPGYMSYEKPIKYNTPTSYTMLNGWFLDNGDSDTGTTVDNGNILQYLTGGSIDTSGYGTVDDPIYMMDLDAVGTAFGTDDKDRVVRANATDNHGPLLAFKASYPDGDTARCWFRDVNSIGAPGAAESIEVTTAGGLGTYTNTGGGAAAEGDEIYANIYTITSFAGSPDLQVYIKQQHPIAAQGDIRVAEWSNASSWDRDASTTPPAHAGCDILLPVKLGGAAIDAGVIVLYGRQTGDTFTHYETSVSITGASRTPIAMETSSDVVNVTKGEHYLLYTSGSAGGFDIGDIIQDVSTADTSPPSWYAEVVAKDEFAVNTTGCLTLRGLRGTITTSDPIYVGTVDEGTASGTPGGTRLDWSGGTDFSTLGQTLTGDNSNAERVLRGVDGAENVAVCQVDETVVGSSKDVHYKDFTTSDTVTGSSEGSVTPTTDSVSIISDYTDVTIAHVNGTLVMNADTAGTFEVGEVVTWTGGSYSAIYLASTTTTEMTLGNVSDETDLNTNSLTITGASSGATQSTNGTGGLTDAYLEGYEFPQQSEGSEYAVVIQGGDVYNAGRTLEDIYAYIQFKCRDGETDVFYTSTGAAIVEEQGQFYIKAETGYSTSKTAPFGTLAGGVFFGAQGVWIEGMDSGDDNSVSLTDDNDYIQEPDTSINVTVTNTRVGDRIIVYLEDGSTGLPDKDQYSLAVAGIAQNSVTMERETADFPKDTPASGWVYVTSVSTSEEHKYRYNSWTGKILTLADEVDNNATGGDDNTLTDAVGTPFTSDKVQVGDIIRNVTDGGWCYVTERTDDNNLEVTINSEGNPWAAGKNYKINSTVVAYVDADYFYVPYLEEIEDTGTDGDPGTATKSLLYVSNRAVGIRVRNVGGDQAIQPFNTTNDILITGMSQSVIRTDDDVYT
jgi:hypothetical protein